MGIHNENVKDIWVQSGLDKLNNQYSRIDHFLSSSWWFFLFSLQIFPWNYPRRSIIFLSIHINCIRLREKPQQSGSWGEHKRPKDHNSITFSLTSTICGRHSDFGLPTTREYWVFKRVMDLFLLTSTTQINHGKPNLIF